jgi:hypothetical protein
MHLSKQQVPAALSVGFKAYGLNEGQPFGTSSSYLFIETTSKYKIAFFFMVYF